jgi:topoisomerase IA-like protein
VRIGQFGPFVSKTVNGQTMRASLPPDLPPADLTPEMVDELLSKKVEGPQKLGVDPESEQMIFLKNRSRLARMCSLARMMPTARRSPSAPACSRA